MHAKLLTHTTGLSTTNLKLPDIPKLAALALPLDTDTKHCAAACPGLFCASRPHPRLALLCKLRAVCRLRAVLLHRCGAAANGAPLHGGTCGQVSCA